MTTHRISFVLAATAHGPMIVNRFDQRVIDGQGIGVGLQLLENGTFDPDQCSLGIDLLTQRREHFGDGVVAIDAGANIGAFSITWGRMMRNWGAVLAVEPQLPLFYALAGNVALNNLHTTVRPMLAAFGASNGFIEVPMLDYDRPASYGSLELRPWEGAEPIGQPVDYKVTERVPLLTVDSMDLERVDLLKIDVERMELDVLIGARETITRCRPIIMVERIKAKGDELGAALREFGYPTQWHVGLDILAIHPDDPTRNIMSEAPPV
jgi:FkbM family methyltransferase